MIKGSEAQKQRAYELLWMLWFDEKSISNVGITTFDRIRFWAPKTIGVGKLFFSIHNTKYYIYYILFFGGKPM